MCRSPAPRGSSRAATRRAADTPARVCVSEGRGASVFSGVLASHEKNAARARNGGGSFSGENRGRCHLSRPPSHRRAARRVHNGSPLEFMTHKKHLEPRRRRCKAASVRRPLWRSHGRTSSSGARRRPRSRRRSGWASNNTYDVVRGGGCDQFGRVLWLSPRARAERHARPCEQGASALSCPATLWPALA